MKKILVTYHMSKDEEDAETCIVVPVSDKLEALADGKRCGIGYQVLEKALIQIARLQGYVFTEICKIEHV